MKVTTIVLTSYSKTIDELFEITFTSFETIAIIHVKTLTKVKGKHFYT